MVSSESFCTGDIKKIIKETEIILKLVFLKSAWILKRVFEFWEKNDDTWFLVKDTGYTWIPIL